MLNIHRILVPFGRSLQILIVLFAVGVAPAAAEDLPPIPPSPMYSQLLQLSGNIYINGAEAPVGTVVTVIEDGKAQNVTVNKKGEYGNEYYNKLIINDRQNCSDVEFYVNGVKTSVETSVFKEAKTEFMNLRIDASIQTNGGSGSSGRSGGSSGGSIIKDPGKKDTDKNEVVIGNNDSKKPIKDVGTIPSTEPVKQNPASDKGSSNFLLIAAIGIVLIVAVAFIIYRSKKK